MKTNVNTLGLALAVLFLISAAWTYYTLFQDNVSLSGYGVLTLTLLIGLAAYYVTIKSQKEVIVYREKVIDKYAQDKANEQSSAATITLDDFKNSISKATNETELFQFGLQTICKHIEAGQGALYVATEENGKRMVELKAGYALNLAENAEVKFDFGEGLIGQAVMQSQSLYIDDVPEGYVKILSGLGSASPRYLFLTPVKNENKTSGVIEVATFTALNETQRNYIESCAQVMAQKMNAA
ncbi:MAG: GAF domain-containing protein [Flammeovirgaceae bacterium]|nr:GAF domain-containing protein [Flammeovirgaceae bacterium]